MGGALQQGNLVPRGERREPSHSPRSHRKSAFAVLPCGLPAGAGNPGEAYQRGAAAFPPGARGGFGPMVLKKHSAEKVGNRQRLPTFSASAARQSRRFEINVFLPRCAQRCEWCFAARAAGVQPGRRKGSAENAGSAGSGKSRGQEKFPQNFQTFCRVTASWAWYNIKNSRRLFFAAIRPVLRPGP